MELTTIRLKVIDDWRHAWKWSSMRFLAAGAAVQTTVVMAPDKVTQHVPEWVMSGLSIFALFCMLAAGLGRVTTASVETHHEPSDPA